MAFTEIKLIGIMYPSKYAPDEIPSSIFLPLMRKSLMGENFVGEGGFFFSLYGAIKPLIKIFLPPKN